MNRRHLLAVLGGSATAAFAGCLGDDDGDTDDDGTENGDDDTTAGETTLDGQFEVLQVAPDGQVVLQGDLLDVTVTLENPHPEPGTQLVELSLGPLAREEQLTLESDEEQSLTFEALDTSGLDPGEVDLTVSAGERSRTGRLTVWEPLDEDEFLAESVGGFVSLEGETREEAEDASLKLDLPPSAEFPNPVVLRGTITDDTWVSTAVEFPDVSIQGIDVEVDVPGGFEGEFDPDAGAMTLEGVLRLRPPDGEIAPDMRATTGQSGGMEGAADFDADPPVVTLVENEARIEESGSPAIDGVLDLPAEAGDTWFELRLAVRDL